MNWIAWLSGFSSVGFIALLAVVTHLIARVNHALTEIEWTNRRVDDSQVMWRDVYDRLDDHGYMIVELQQQRKRVKK